jgi:hypothetical protein
MLGGSPFKNAWSVQPHGNDVIKKLSRDRQRFNCCYLLVAEIYVMVVILELLYDTVLSWRQSYWSSFEAMFDAQDCPPFDLQWKTCLEDWNGTKEWLAQHSRRVLKRRQMKCKFFWISWYTLAKKWFSSIQQEKIISNVPSFVPSLLRIDVF